MAWTRILRFRLKSLLLLMVGIAAAFAWLGNHYAEFFREQLAIKKIESGAQMVKASVTLRKNPAAIDS